MLFHLKKVKARIFTKKWLEHLSHMTYLASNSHQTGVKMCILIICLGEIQEKIFASPLPYYVRRLINPFCIF